MSIFTKIKDSIVHKFVSIYLKKEFGNMKDYIQLFFDLIVKLVQPSQGTKFLVSFGSLGLIGYLSIKSLGGPYTIPVIGGICVAYYIADIFAKKMQKGESK